MNDMKDEDRMCFKGLRALAVKVVGALRGPLRAAWPFMAVVAAVALLDFLLQRQARSQLEEYLFEPLSYALEAAGVSLKWGLILAAPALLLGRRAKALYLALWPYLVVVETVEAVARHSYSMSLDGDWLMILRSSSWTEMREFLWQFGGVGIAVVAVSSLAVLAAGWMFFARMRYPASCKASVLAGVLCCMPFAVSNLLLTNPLCAGNEVMFTFLPIDTVHNHALYSDIARTASEPRLPVCTYADPKAVAETLGVVVAGESATRSHWHLYGYGRPTTPMMDSVREELVVFKNIQAIYSTTGKSLRTLLTEASRENPYETRSTFAQQCAAAEYTCSLFSGQYRWGRWEGIETLLFAGCQTKFDLHEQPDSTELKDDALLPPVEEAVRQETDSGQIVFIHLMGSHGPPLFRYPLERSIYPRYEGDIAPGISDPNSKEAYKTDLYDNTIAFTDLILGKTITMLKSLRRPCFLAYISDHGETPTSSHWRDATSPDLLAVPFVIWFSPEYRTRYPETVAAVSALVEEPREMDRILPIFRLLVHLDRANAR